jgi:hypothetical protein
VRTLQAPPPALLLIALCLALAGAARAEDWSAWQRAYDPATRTRFIHRTGLGRVFDSRYPQLGCRGEVKFPLGHWKQGEVREYQLDCTRGKRPLKVTIEEIDFVYDGVPHSLRFHWLFMEGRGRGTDMRYVYSPLRGLVDVQGNE